MKTLYDEIGPETLKLLVVEFYDRVFTSEKIGPLFKNDRNEIMDKQYMFLTQFLGGPQLYSNHYGHPRMRMRHMPHKITNEAKEEWLRCMKEAVASLNIDETIKNKLYQVFPQLAQHMVNS